MKYIAIAVLLWLSTIVPTVAADAPQEGFPVIAFTDQMKEALKGSANWQHCGEYFAEAQTTKGKLVTFVYDESAHDAGPIAILRWVVVPAARIQTAINERVPAPSVDVMGNGKRSMFILKMKFADYKAGLPCLDKGVGI